MARSLFVVRVPEVEPWVAQLRDRFDPSAKRGLGAHVTVLHSRLPPDRIDRTVIGLVMAVASSVAPFGYQVTRVGRFPGTLYLAVAPTAPFMSLNEKLLTALPAPASSTKELQPLVPHISLVRKSESENRDVESELALVLARHGPISCACREIVLLESSSGRWRPVQEFVLSGGTGNPSPEPS